MNTKIEKILKRTLIVVFALCLSVGLYFLSSTQRAYADTTTNVSNSAAYTYEGTANSSYDGQSYQYWQIKLTFNGVSDPAPKGGPKDGYNVNDNATTHTTMDLMDYIVIDEITPTGKNPNYMGKSAREICNANAAGNLDKSYGAPTRSDGGNIYGPIRVNIGSYGVRIRCCEDFVALNNLKIILKSGYSYEVDNDTVLTWTCDVVFYRSGNTFVEYIEEQDVTNKVKLNYMGESGGVYEVDFTLDGVTNVLPLGLGTTWANDNASKFKVDPMEYIKIGNNTARAIVAFNGPYSGSGGAPMSWGGVYAPIGVVVDGNGIIRIKIYSNYCAYSNLSITIANGMKLLTTVGNKKIIYTINGNVTYSYDSGYFVNEATTKVDAKDAARLVYHSESGGILEIDLKFDGVSNVYPSGVTSATWVNDHASMGTMDLMSKIKIGANTARAIVNSNSIYSGVGGAPMSWGGTWAPIGVVVDGNGVIRIKIYSDYCSYSNLSITVASGLVWFTSDGVMIKCTEDVVYSYDNGAFVNVNAERINVDGKANLSLVSTNNNTPASDGTYSKINLTFDGITNYMNFNAASGARGGFWVNDNATNNSAGVDLMNYVYINGSSARSLVGTSGTGLVNALPVFGPVAICVWPNSIEIRVRNSYINYEDLYITIKSGLGWLTTDGTLIKTTKDYTYRYYVSTAGDCSYEYQVDLSETPVHFEEIVKADKEKNGNSFTRIMFWFDYVNQVKHKDGLAGGFWVNDHATDYSNGVDLMEYIYVNGVSARDLVNANINGELDKTYVGLELASNDFGPVAVAVIDGKYFQIRVDDSYLDYGDLFITIKAGLSWWTADEQLLTTSEDMTFCFKKSDSWTEEDHYLDTYKLEDLIAADTFDMMKGASVRNVEYAGIRFGAQYAEDELDYWNNHGGCEIEIGMLLTKASILGDDELTIESVNADKAYKLVCTNNSETAENGYYVFYGGISPMINAASYNVAYVGRAYVKYTVNGETYYKYATVNDNVRTVVYVAQMALSKANLTAAQTEFLQGILDDAGAEYYSLSKAVLPVWAGDTVYGETVSFIGKDDVATLIYAPTDIVKVYDYYLQTEYEEGVDFTIENGNEVHLTENTRINYWNVSEYYYDAAQSPYAIETEDGKYLKFSEVNANTHQVRFYYEHSDSYAGETPTDYSAKFANVNDKVNNGGTLNVCVIGDSITKGCGSSGYIMASESERNNLLGGDPYVVAYKSYIEIVKEFIASKGVKVNLCNTAVGGSGIGDGSSQIDNWTITPDLAIIAFGMNNMGRTPESFKAAAEDLIAKIRALNPDCEILLVSPMIPNPEVVSIASSAMPGNIVDFEALSLLPLVSEYDNVGLATMTTVSSSIYSDVGKEFEDINSNSINHPNDFLHGIYAQTVLTALLGSYYYL